MAYTDIVAQLKAERAKLDEAIAALEAVTGDAAPVAKKRGRPAGATKAAKPAKKKGKRVMSPEAKAKIAAAQKARWEKAKKA